MSKRIQVITIKAGGEQAHLIDTRSIGEQPESVVKIEKYQVLVFPETGEQYQILSGQKHSVSLSIATNKKKVITVLVHNPARKADNPARETDAPLYDDYEEFKGRMIVFYQCNTKLHNYHILLIDSLEETYRNISFDSFGYTFEDINSIFKVIMKYSHDCITDNKDNSNLLSAAREQEM